MSDIDKRVVQMDFDNKKFEKNVKQSIESLNTLKTSLNFDGVSTSIDQVTVKINRMEYAVAAAITNITNRVVNLGIQIVKSLSVDNISAGWTKFGQKTTSVATLMAQTLKVSGEELTDAAEKLSTVNDLMEKLVWFSDETSYTFTDMVDNASKFIAAGLDLDVSVKAMEGIATWAALSGQNASTASRAMYQLSQAMGKGKIQLIDWKSIQTANMDTAQFRENVLETAVAMGQLTKEGDKFVTKTGKKFTQNQFTEQLSSGWFTSDVLTKTLEKYSSAADEIYELAKKEGKTASEIIEEYGDTLDEFGVKAFKAAQEARTLSDAITSVKDAVASKWMTTSELIFGDKDEAVELWTDLANELYEVFAESGNFRNEILKVWKALEGRADLFAKGGEDQGAFWNIYDAIVAVKKVISDAWNTIFPITQMEEESDQAQEIGNNIKVLTSRFKEFTKTLKLSEASSLRLKKVFEGIFSIFKGVIVILKAIKFIIDPIIDLGKQLVTAILDKIIMLSGKININGEALLKISDKIHDSLEKLFDKTIDFSGIFATIIKIAKAIGDAVVSVTKKVYNFAKSLSLLDKVKSTFSKIGKTVINVFNKISSAIKSFWESLTNKGSGETIDKKVTKPVRNAITDLSGSTGKVSYLNSLANIFKNIAAALKTFGKSLLECSKKIITFAKSINIFEKIQNVLAKFKQGLVKLLPYINKIKDAFVNFAKKIVKSIETITKAIKEFISQCGSKNIEKKVTTPVRKALRSFSDTVEETTDVVEKASLKTNIFNTLVTLFKSLYELLIGILTIATAMVSVLAKIFKVLGKALQWIGNSLINIVNGNFELKGWQKALLITAAILLPIAALLAFIGKMVYNIFYTVSAIIRPLGVLVDSLSGVIDKIGLKMVSNVVSEFAKSILEISISLLIIAAINPDRLWPAVAAMATISVIMAALVAALIFIQKQTTKVVTSTSLVATQVISAKRTFNMLGTGFDGLTQEIKKLLQANAVARVLQAFGMAMLQAAAALYIMAKIDPKQLWDGVGVFAVLTALIAVLAKFAAKNENSIKNTLPGIGQMITLAIVIKSIIKVLATFKDIDESQRANLIGATVVIGAFLMLCLFFLTKVNEMSKEASKSEIKTSGKMIKQISSIAQLILSFSISIKILATIPWNTLGVTLGIVGGFLLEVAGFLAIVNLSSRLIKDYYGSSGIEESWKQMLAMSILLGAFAASIGILSLIPWNKLGVALAAVGIFFVEFAGMVTLINLASRLVKKSGNLKETTKQMLTVSLMLYSFAITVLILSKLSWEKMLVALTAIGAFFIEFAAMVTLINLASRLVKKSGNLKETTKQMRAVSLMLISFATTMGILSFLSWESLAKGLVAIGAFFAEFAALVILISLATRIGKINFKDINKLLNGLSLVLISFAVMTKIIASVDIEHILFAAGAVAIVFASIGALCLALGEANKGNKKSVAYAKTVISLLLMFAAIVAALKILSSQPIDGLLASAGAIGMVLLSFTAMAFILGKDANSIKAFNKIAKSFLLFGVSLAAIAVSLYLVAMQPWDRLLAAAGAIGMVLLSFTAMAFILGKDANSIKAFNKIAKSFLIFSASLIAIGAALAITAMQPWDRLLAAAGAIVAVVASFVGIVKLMQVFKLSGMDLVKSITGLSAGLIIVSAALIIFVAAMKQLESVDWNTVWKAIALVSIQLMALAVVAAITQKIIPAILALASAFLLIGLGMILAATAIQMVTNAILSLTAASTDQLASVKSMISDFVSIIGDTLNPLLSGLIEAIASNIPIIVETVVNAITDLISKLAEKSDEILSGLETLISGTLKVIKDNAGTWTTCILDTIMDVLSVLSNPENIGRVIKGVLTFVKNLLAAVVANKDILGEILDSIFDILGWLLKTLTANIIKIAGTIAEVILTLIAAAIQIVVASLGALSKLFLIFLSSILLILAETFAGLSSVIFEVFKVIVKECLTALVDVIIYFQDAFKAIGILMMELIARGLISIIEATFDGLFKIIDKVFNTNISDTLKQASDNLASKAKETVSGLSGSLSDVKNAVKKASNNISDIVNYAITETASAVDEGVDQIHSSVTSATESLGKDASDGYAKGINESAEEAKKASKNLALGCIDATQEAQNSHSPSKVFAELGMWAAVGYANGIADNMGASSDVMTQMVAQALTAAQSTLDSQNGDDLTIKVGMDISGVEEQSRNISSIMSSINNVTTTAYGRNAAYNSNAMNKETGGGSVINTDNSKAVTYNNVFNVTSTDPEKSADEIDRALSRQAMMAKLAHGGI